MGTFFHGWRRKSGLLTLVMALVLLLVWMKSLVEDNHVDLVQTARRCERLNSTKGCVRWECFQSDIPAQYFVTTFPRMYSDKLPLADGLAYVCVDEEYNNYCEVQFFFMPEALNAYRLYSVKEKTIHRAEWQGHWCGFGHGNWNGWATLSIVSIPYWSITILLTLLSAYLILTKPCNSTLTKTAEPLPNEGT